MTIEAADFRELAVALVATAQKAGAAIAAAYHPSAAVRYKSDRSPVTDADHAAEEIVLRDLSKLMPHVPVIAEEQVAAGILPEAGDFFFLVDPIDGTKEFLKGSGEFTVNIALIKQGKPCFGLVYAPAFQRCYVTLEPAQASRCELSPSSEPAAAADLDFQKLTGEAPPERPLTSIVSRSHLRPRTQAFLARLAAPKHITMGSSLKFCALAEGEADIYPRFGPTSEWDTAAGHAILNAAGGCVLTLDKRPLFYGKKAESFVNPAFIAFRRPYYADVIEEA